MKHLLNNLSEEEKQSILEQHNGGMRVFSENFKRLVGHKSGTILNEQPQTGATTQGATYAEPGEWDDYSRKITRYGDPYEYKSYAGSFYTRKKGDPNWIEITPEAFGNDQQKYKKALEELGKIKDQAMMNDIISRDPEFADWAAKAKEEAKRNPNNTENIHNVGGYLWNK